MNAFNKNRLTPRQQEVYNKLVELVDRNGYPPTCMELATAMGLASANAAAGHLAAFKRKGLIKISRGAARGISIIGRDSPAAQRDEALTVISDLLSDADGADERARQLLSRVRDGIA
ncbi:hypothetical protein [Erwinia endophytica]|uniref:LexA family protein n=1 Tax=Erwinia endophytica TaxID=1563158 RepID=UPI001F04A22D|nr:hypothetical protein [Erwinia endophytica]